MNWKFFTYLEKVLAYQIEGRTLYVTDQVGEDALGEMCVFVEREDDFYVNTFELLPNGQIKFTDWIDLRQFNNSHNFLAQVHLLNAVQAELDGTIPEELSLEKALAAPCGFSWKTIDERNELYDLEADLYLSVNQKSPIRLQKQFVKYTMLSPNIADVIWTANSLFHFGVHLMKVLKQEEQRAGETMFLQTDKEVQEFLVAHELANI